mmetsp:Transcript_56958/g.146588  ORF Transcript_56958/g.146588 Transcript_56958/m.146588 type:complete len:291 (+) Transcript_56958:1631-2503(+)
MQDLMASIHSSQDFSSSLQKTKTFRMLCTCQRWKRPRKRPGMRCTWRMSLARSFTRGLSQSYGVKQRSVPSVVRRMSSSHSRPSKWMEPIRASRVVSPRPSRAWAKARPQMLPVPVKKRGGRSGPRLLRRLAATLRAMAAGLSAAFEGRLGRLRPGVVDRRVEGSEASASSSSCATAFARVSADCCASCCDATCAAWSMTTVRSLVSDWRCWFTTLRKDSSVFTAQHVYLLAPGPRRKVRRRRRGLQSDASSDAAFACHQSCWSSETGFVIANTYQMRTFLRRRRSMASM